MIPIGRFGKKCFQPCTREFGKKAKVGNDPKFADIGRLARKANGRRSGKSQKYLNRRETIVIDRDNRIPTFLSIVSLFVVTMMTAAA